MGKTSGSNRTLDGPGIGKVTKGSSKSRALDGPGVGKAASGSDKTKVPATSVAGGKAHPGLGKGVAKEGPKQTVSSSKVKCYAQGPQGKHAGGY